MSGASVMRPEWPPLGTLYSEIVPEGSARPMPVCFVYQTFPSGPGAMPMGPVFVVEVLKRLNIVPIVVRFPRALGAVLWCVNQIFPSGPAQIQPGSLAVGIMNSVIVMLGPLMFIEAPPAPVGSAEPAAPDPAAPDPAAPKPAVPAAVPAPARPAPPVPQ